MALDHLRTSLTKGNLWLYILSELQLGDATPSEIRSRVLAKRGFAPAAITFYSVIYRLRQEGLVKRSSDSFRSAYAITAKGKDQLLSAKFYLDEVQKSIGQT
ncbi:MAG: PadR family transcriptional regulator [Nitrososphaerales archaeon]